MFKALPILGWWLLLPVFTPANAGESRATSPTVEVKGRIARVQVGPGQGTPFLEVEQNGRTAKVLLGSLRYLLEHNFNPKAGAAVRLTGIRKGEEIEAILITLPQENKTLRLRDDAGRPLWIRAHR